MPNERVIIVTGASSGIGSALAIAAARHFRLVLVARRADRLDAVAHRIAEAGGACIARSGDVTAPEMPARIVDAAIAAFGRIDVVVNNAGAGAYGALLDQSDAAIAAQWQLHVAAPLRLARAARAQLERTRGQLVFIGSGAARIPLPHFGSYAPAKAAIRAAAIQLRRELRGKGIAVTYVDPGVVATEFHDVIGVRRAGEIAASPDRVARAILRGIERRRATVNAVWWQTAGAVAGEWLGTFADPIIVSRFTMQPRDAEQGARAEPQGAESAAERFEKVLEPLGRRMERVKLSPTFVREALVPGALLELGALAMRWAGMPNKNERAALREVLDALAAAGYIEPTEEDTWKVLRAAD